VRRAAKLVRNHFALDVRRERQSSTLFPLAQHLNRILNLLTEEVIRDEPASHSASSRCVSTPDPGRQNQPASGGPSASMAELVARNASTDRPDIGGAVATDAADGAEQSRTGNTITHKTR